MPAHRTRATKSTKASSSKARHAHSGQGNHAERTGDGPEKSTRFAEPLKEFIPSPLGSPIHPIKTLPSNPPANLPTSPRPERPHNPQLRSPVNAQGTPTSLHGDSFSSQRAQSFTSLQGESPSSRRAQSASSRGVSPWMPRENSPYARPTGRPEKLHLSDLQCIRNLGRGAFGRVFAVQVDRKNSEHPADVPGAMFALKAFYKPPIRERENLPPYEAAEDPKAQKSIERSHLAFMPWHPFVSGIVDVFVDERNLYQLMELGHCGTLGDRIWQNGPMCTDHARFYFTNIVLALEYIHSHGVVHRDIKPDNILLCANGYLMLTDFGCAGHVMDDREFPDHGTLWYNSPENFSGDNSGLLEHSSQRMSLDWWAAACVLFEMVTREVAFRRRRKESQTAIAERLTSGRFKWPSNIVVDHNLRDLVKSMLKLHQEDRIGLKPDVLDGVVHQWEIRGHPFMKDVPWKDMLNRVAPAPYMPNPLPDLTKGVYDKGVPQSHIVPGITCVIEKAHRRYVNHIRGPKDKKLDHLVPSF